jgi:hypothetical protein
MQDTGYWMLDARSRIQNEDKERSHLETQSRRGRSSVLHFCSSVFIFNDSPVLQHVIFSESFDIILTEQSIK